MGEQGMKQKLRQRQSAFSLLRSCDLSRLISVGILISMVFTACATVKKETVKVEPVVERTGIMGRVVPVDSSGAEIVQEDSEKIVINCIPVKKGSQVKDRSITGNSGSDGSFSLDLKSGEWFIEVFLEGFYVKSFHVILGENRRVDMGEIRLQRIESGSGVPLKGDEIEEAFVNEGDVSIQPPTH